MASGNGVTEGAAWVYGDHIDTDILLPEVSLIPESEWPTVVLTPLDPEFSKSVQAGDVIVAGRNFGCGSARASAKAIKMCRVGAVVAESFARNFFRDAINTGLPILVCPDAGKIARKGDRVRVDLAAGTIENLSSGAAAEGEPLPPFVLEILENGGIVPHLRAEGILKG